MRRRSLAAILVVELAGCGPASSAGGAPSRGSVTPCDRVFASCRARRLPNLILRPGAPMPDGAGALGSLHDPPAGIIGFDAALLRAWKEDGQPDARTVQVVLGSVDHPERLHWPIADRVVYVILWGDVCVPYAGPQHSPPSCTPTTWGTAIDARTGSFIVGGS